MEIVSGLQQEILHIFPMVSDSDQFYLTGGTALAQFYLKHRKSKDLDFFSSVEALVVPFGERLEKKMNAAGMTTERKRGFQTFVEFFVEKDAQQTIVQLAQESPFRLQPTRHFAEYPGLHVDDLQDLAANKLLALFGRAAVRDFVDVYFLVERANFSQSELMHIAKEKDPGFDLYWLGVAMERIHSFNDTSPEMLYLLQPLPFQKLSEFFEGWREEIAKEIKK